MKDNKKVVGITAVTAKLTAVTAKFHIREEQSYVVKNCPICGCSEHKLLGCAKHWAHHKKNKEGLCEQKNPSSAIR